ncbi:MAG: AzlD domain-containing protein [Alteromonadaceae bacterium]|nr:AzlD domain-containing protein [Alteromonadaceae bacterium]
MTLITILLLAVITFSSRYLFLHPGIPLRIGAKLSSFLSFSAPAVLTAIWVPIIFIKDGSLNISPDNPYLIAATVAVVVSIKTKSVYITLASSGVVFVLLRVFL